MPLDQTLNYRIAGNGYPVLFLHGFLESNHMWEAILPKLSAHFKCILIELPGHGQSLPFHSAHPSINSMATSVLKTLKKITSSPVDIVGHSLGGYVALNIVEQLNHFENKLILLNSHPWEDSSTKQEERNRVIDVVKKNKGLFIKTAIPNLYRSPNEQFKNIQEGIEIALKMDDLSIINSLKAMRDRKDQSSILEKLTQQCLVIQGEFDHLIPAEKMKATTAELNTKYSLVYGAGHMAHHERSDRVSDLITRFQKRERQ
jgi:pimeloyl-ACP methyl ester carboxylesterase